MSTKLEKAKNYIILELAPLSTKLSFELAEALQRNEYMNEESYYRKAWEIYQYKYIKKYMKELIYFYKQDIAESGLTNQDIKNIKDFLILGNVGLILKTLEAVLPSGERNGKEIGDFITEGMKSIIESVEKYEADFTTEKTTKGTKIKLLKITEEGLDVEIKGNKPFWDIDIEIHDKEEDLHEIINTKLEWKEGSTWEYTAKVRLTDLSNEYEESKNIKLSVSKKVGQPSTFFTNNVFYALKNHLNKIEPLKISNNYFILSKQVKKIKEKYEETFNKEASERWIAYYLTIQNGDIKTMTPLQYNLYEKKKNKEKLNEKEKGILKKIDDIQTVIKKEGKVYKYLTVNKNKRRALMIRNKATKKKNKVNYSTLDKSLNGREDEMFYDLGFETLLDKKEKEIKKIRLLYSGVDSLDSSIGGDEDTMNRYDIIQDNSSLDNLNYDLEKQYRYKELWEKMRVVLSPRERFYIHLYFTNKLPLDLLSEKGFYKSGSPGSNITEVRNVLKSAMGKLLFYIKYKKNNY